MSPNLQRGSMVLSAFVAGAVCLTVGHVHTRLVDKRFSAAAIKHMEQSAILHLGPSWTLHLLWKCCHLLSEAKHLYDCTM